MNGLYIPTADNVGRPEFKVVSPTLQTGGVESVLLVEVLWSSGMLNMRQPRLLLCFKYTGGV